MVITDPTKRILVLSDTCPGQTHDQTGAHAHAICEPIPPEVLVPRDRGCVGVPKEHPSGHVSLPDTKPTGPALSAEAQTRNQGKARRRVLVEHALGGVTRVRAVTDVLRNAVDVFADRLMLVAWG